MRLLITIIIVSFSVFSGFGQIEVSQKIINYGEIDFRTDRVKDLLIENKSDKADLLLKSDFSEEYEILFSNRTIEANSSITLRVKYNPRKKGNFNDKIELWFSSQTEPLVLTFKGDVQYVDKRDNPSCPDFNTRPVECCDQNDVIIEMIDKASRKSIHKGVIRLVVNGEMTKVVETDRGGLSTLQLPISYYLILVDADGYLSRDTALYINRFQNYVLFEMEKDESIVEEEIVIAEEKEIVEEIDEVVIEKPKAEIKDESEILPESKFARNNIVFVIDVSSSMNSRGKMDILKNSMYELVEVLRDIDELTVITYATNPEVVLNTQSVRNKDDIKSLIRDLEAGGSTSGAKAFKMAYSMAKKNYMSDGNNQIIVATDGAFRAEDNVKIKKMVKKNRGHITTSVLGIRSSSSTSQKLSEFSDIGKGSFILLDDYDDSKKALIQEIRKQSKR